MKRVNEDLSLTHFLNVDLDLFSKSNLQPLVTAMGNKVRVLHFGRYKGTYRAHLEVAAEPRNPNANSRIRAFCALIRALPKAAIEQWNAAKIRDFNIGVQAMKQPNSYELALAEETVRAVSQVKARIVFTVYGADLGESAGRARRSSGSKRSSTLVV
jgi:hypothetical protein